MLNELSSVKNALSVLVLALVVALYLFANSPFFETDQIEWTGLTHLSPGQLDAYVGVETINVWRVDMRELVSLLTKHPWIVSAKVTWRWPNHLIVRVKERTPIAQIPTEAGWLLLDGEGNLLPPIHGDAALMLPIATNVNVEAPEQLRATARLIALIPPSLLGIISEWNAQERTFVTRSGVEILMGEPVELEEKFRLLERILADLEARGEQAVCIDLGVPKTPVVSTVR